MKKGQVTMFIIFAIFIVGIIAIYFTIFNGSNQENGIQKDFPPIYQKVQECLEIISEEATIYVGQHGGYYNVPDSMALDYFGKKVPYYYLNNQMNIPERERVELELNNYINDKIENCLNFENFISQGFNVSSKNPEVTTSIKDDYIEIKMNCHLVVSRESKTQIFEEFNGITPFNVIELLDSSKEIVDDYSKEPGVLCVSCLNDISIKNRVTINSNFFNNNTIFEITSENEEEGSENKLKWIFVVGK